MKINLLLLVLANFFIFNNFSCEEDLVPFVGNTDFTLEILDKSSRKNVGDTLVILSNFDPEIPIKNSQSAHNNRGQSISYELHLLKIEPNNLESTRGVTSFDLIVEKGRVEDAGYLSWAKTARVISYSCSDTLCKSDLKLICKEPGYYCVFISGGTFANGTGTVDNVFLNSNNNTQILKEINTFQIFCHENGADVSIRHYEDRKDIFCFEVE